jgi:hypothetical protein
MYMTCFHHLINNQSPEGVLFCNLASCYKDNKETVTTKFKLKVLCLLGPALLALTHTPSPFLLYFSDRGSHFCPKPASDYDSPNLHLLSSWDYRHEPLHPTQHWPGPGSAPSLETYLLQWCFRCFL